jgi:hypothetical protein
MPANTDPIFTLSGDVSTNGTTGMGVLVTAAANDYTGIGANNFLIWTADSTNGGVLQRIRAKAGGTNIATVLRLFINNGSTNGTATNNVFFGELSLPATTAIATAATIDMEYSMGNLALPAGWRVYGGLGTAVAAGWVFCGIGGKY